MGSIYAVRFWSDARLSHRTPWHWYQNSTLHLLDQRNGLVHCFTPALHSPAHFSPRFSLLEIGKLPQMMHRVQLANLHEPRPDPFHHLASSFEPSAPVCLPFEQVAGMQGIRTKLEEASKVPRRRCGPEGEFLHQGGIFMSDQALQLLVKLVEIGM